MTPTAPRRLLFVTSDRELRARLAEGLGTAFCVTVADSAPCAEQRIAMDPAIVLLDLSLADADGVDLVRWMASRLPAVPIVTLSRPGTDERIIAAVRAGAHGCLFTNEAIDRIVSALEEALDGGRPLSHGMTRVLLEHIRRSAPPPSKLRRAVRPLTERERVALAQMARGLSYEDTAKTLDVSVNTVRSYVRAIYDKLGVNSRTEAVLLGIKLGLLKGTPYPGMKLRS